MPEHHTETDGVRPIRVPADRSGAAQLCGRLVNPGRDSAGHLRASTEGRLIAVRGVPTRPTRRFGT